MMPAARRIGRNDGGLLEPTAPIRLENLAVNLIHDSTVPVREKFQGRMAWEGVVHVFDLEGHPTAKRAYAWSSPIEGSEKRRFFAVLQLGAIKSPVDAVRAAIVAEHRASAADSKPDEEGA
jgi:hypothetical protein